MRNKRGKSRKSKLNFLFDHADVDRLDIYFNRQQHFLESVFLLLTFSSQIFLTFFAHILDLNYVFFCLGPDNFARKKNAKRGMEENEAKPAKPTICT